MSSEGRDGLWKRISDLVVAHPVRVLIASLILVTLPVLAVPTIRLSHDTLEELPADSEAARGFDALSEHFPSGELAPLILVVDDPEAITEPGSLRAIADLSRNLKRLETVASVRSVAMPTDGDRPDIGGDTAGLEQAAQLGERLGQAADGAGRLQSGLARVEDGLARIDARLPELRDGLTEATDGARRLLDGVGEVREGVAQLESGAGELADGLVEARDGAARLRDEVAVPAEESVRAAWETLAEEFSVGRTDPAYPDALREVGEVYGRITGEDPRTGEQVDPDYEGLPEALDELATGLDEAVSGTRRLQDGLGELDVGLARIEDGLAQLASGLSDAEPGVAELASGIDRLLDGVRRLEDGAGELRRRLGEGAARIEEADLSSLLAAAVPGAAEGSEAPFIVTPELLEALPEVRDQLELFLADDDTRTRVFIGLDTEPFSPDALSAVDDVREVAELSVQRSPLEDATVRLTGTSAFFDAVDREADADLPLIIVAVVLGVFLVLVLLLRALVAPIYMVLTVLLSFASALGLTALVFQGLLGQAGLAWWLPPFLFVLLVALGADYNIYLMSRVREEADTKPTRVAVADATRTTGGVITSAGLILAGTFAALMAAELSSLVQMGFATTVGILLDTFVVRSLLVPSIATLLGRHNWWPSARSAAEIGEETGGDTGGDTGEDTDEAPVLSRS